MVTQTFSGARSQCVARKGDLLTENHLKPNSPNQYLVTTTLDVLKPGLKRPLIWIGVERYDVADLHASTTYICLRLIPPEIHCTLNIY